MKGGISMTNFQRFLAIILIVGFLPVVYKLHWMYQEGTYPDHFIFYVITGFYFALPSLIIFDFDQDEK